MLKESKIDGGDIMQTLAEQLKQEGIKIGEEIGEKRGERRGEIKGIEATAKRILKKEFDLDTIVEITGLKPSDIEKLREVSN
jgi:hypothetical protein